MSAGGNSRFAPCRITGAAFSLLACVACDDGVRSLGLGPAAQSIGASGAAGSGDGASGTSGQPGAASSGASGVTTGGAGPAGNGGAGAVGAGAAPTAGATLTRISVSSTGAEANSASVWGKLSDDGRVVVFYSGASNLAPPDDGDNWDIFAHDRETHRTIVVSLNANGEPGDQTSWVPGLSPDGQSICYESWATNFAPGRSTDWPAIYVNGPLNRLDDFVPDPSPVTPADADNTCRFCAISTGGSLVAFESSASNLIAGTTSAPGIYLFHASSGLTERLRFADDSDTELIPLEGHGPVMSGDGSLIAVEVADSSGFDNVLAQDLETGVTTPLAAALDGETVNGTSYRPRISADGRRIVFLSFASNLVRDDTNGLGDAFVRDFVTGTIERVSVSNDGGEANGATIEAALSGDGRFVAFISMATNLVENGSQGPRAVFLRDLVARTTVELPLPPVAPTEVLEGLALNYDGSVLVFHSDIANLVADDRNGAFDLFALAPIH